MKKIIRKLLPLILLAATVMFVLLGIGEVKAQKTYVKTQGTITSITEELAANNEDYEYTVLVKYTVDGKEYESELGSYSSSMKVGKTVEILYNPDKPSKIVKSGYLGAVLMFGMAALALLSAAVVTLRRLRGGR